MENDRPVGREEVREAVLETAERLFDERGVGEVSLREIARGAGVNLGLLHRHFGNKEVLLAALFERRSAAGAVRMRMLGSAEAALASIIAETAHGSYVRVLAAALQAGAAPVHLASTGESANALVQLLLLDEPARDADDAPVDARLVAAAAFALVLGWRHFGRFLVATAGLEAVSPVELDAALTDLVQRMVASVPVADLATSLDLEPGVGPASVGDQSVNPVDDQSVK